MDIGDIEFLQVTFFTTMIRRLVLKTGLTEVLNMTIQVIFPKLSPFTGSCHAIERLMFITSIDSLIAATNL